MPPSVALSSSDEASDTNKVTNPFSLMHMPAVKLGPYLLLFYTKFSLPTQFFC